MGNPHADRIAALRAACAAIPAAAWIAPTQDPHLSEYVPRCWRFREWLSGFTGSAGTLLVTRDAAFLWTDSRYWLQAARQLQGTGVTLMREGDPATPDLADWIARHLPAGSRVALDAKRISLSAFEKLRGPVEAAGITLDTGHDLEPAVWRDAPAMPTAPVRAFAPEAGLRPERLALLRRAARAAGCGRFVLSSLPDIAWTLGLRGADIAHNPIFIAYLAIGARGARLYVGEGKVDARLAAALAADGVSCRPYRAALADFARLAGPTAVCAAQTTLAVWQALPDPRRADNPVTQAKAVKSPEEAARIRNAMREDGVALAEFWAEFEEAVARGETMTELDVVARLHAHRARRPGFLMESFGTIAGSGPNGAVVHYQPTADHHSAVLRDTLLLVDSGAQYEDGTTDITRTVAVGRVPSQARRDYTLVLRGAIALARARFPQGTCGMQLDAIAREPLWRAGENFLHGTGHGVGFCLTVHEGPQSISPRASEAALLPLRPGMLTSDEPGLYREGFWGVRTENLVLARPSDIPGFLEFEVMTLCPIDTRPIERALLPAEDAAWLNAYHARVREALADRLTERARRWLLRATEPI